MEKQKQQLQQRLWIFSMITAPLLMAIAQFFWVNGVLNDTAGWLQSLSFLFWIFAFQGMFIMVGERFPRYAVYGFVVAVYACLGGNNFGIDGIFNEALGINSLEAAGELHAKFGAGGIISFYLPGLLFPLSLLVLGVQLWRAQKIETWLVALFIIASIGFPLSRMPRIEWIAHVDNVLMLATMSLLLMRARQTKPVTNDMRLKGAEA